MWTGYNIILYTWKFRVLPKNKLSKSRQQNTTEHGHLFRFSIKSNAYCGLMKFSTTFSQIVQKALLAAEIRTPLY